jgi:hypothetical protein
MDCFEPALCFLSPLRTPQERWSLHISVSSVCLPGTPESECIHTYAWNILFGILPNEMMVMCLCTERCDLNIADV